MAEVGNVAVSPVTPQQNVTSASAVAWLGNCMHVSVRQHGEQRDHSRATYTEAAGTGEIMLARIRSFAPDGICNQRSNGQP